MEVHAEDYAIVGETANRERYLMKSIIIYGNNKKGPKDRDPWNAILGR